MGKTLEALGSDQPFGALVLEWLWARKPELPGILLLVPTAQSGRLIRSGLAEKGGALAPKIVTASYFLHPGEGAPEAVEILAWIEVLESIEDWAAYAEAFPQPPSRSDGPGWAMGLAKSLVTVRAGLIEGGFMIRSAASWIKDSIEGPRWADLARLEAKVETKLSDWGCESRNAIVSRHQFSWPEEVREIVLVGMADLSPSVVRILENAPVSIRILVANKTDLDEWGQPLEVWAGREISWPKNGSVTLSGDARQQAAATLEKVAEGGFSSNRITLASADEEVGAELVRSFGRSGWVIHNPGSQRMSSLADWLVAWRKYLKRAEAAEVMDLLTFVQTGRLVKHDRVNRARALSRMRNDHLVRSADDVTRTRILLEEELEEAGESPRTKHVEAAVKGAKLTEETMAELAASSDRFLRSGFHEGMKDLLEILDPERTSGAEEWLVETEAVAAQVKRPASFWLELLQSGLQSISDPPPEERVLDVLGWLELSLERGEHLVICGMNEGLVPSRASTDSWLPEGTRRLLGLFSDESRHARDAYLLHTMLDSRRTSGRVDLLLGKSTGSGDVLQPSRLLLAAKGDELARRVKLLFQKISPPEDGLSWDLSETWKWQVDRTDRPEKMNVTGFSDYLACPFRFYLKHVKKMQVPEPERGEWNARDFGNLMHQVLENFGRDKSARAFSKEDEIEKWTHAELSRLLADRLGGGLPTAVRIQYEVMKQRFTWFARKQAREYQAGWRITEVERSFELSVGSMTVRGQIDRIERNEETGLCRVLDYKTSSQKKNVANAHGTELRSNFEWPEHLRDVAEVKTFLPVGRFGKVVEARWTNLQVALYAAAHGELPEVGYFALGSSESNMGLSMWPDFGEAEVESALVCAGWVVSRISGAESPFWPPAKTVRYDDYQSLSFGKIMEEVVR